MKLIRLEELHLVNFKGVQEARYTFDGDTNICGRNGSGKSTIYDGYLWCLFGKNAFGGQMNVQPLDKANKVVHNLVTEATVVISMDGMRMKVTRKLAEDWVKPRGVTELVLKGTTQTRFINDVPMGVKEFDEKLSEIFNIEDWFMLSSINIIPGMKQEERRARLQKIAPAFDEEAIMFKYPAVWSAHKEGKSIVELARQNKLSKDEAKKELDEIPARIDQQERLRVQADWADLEASADTARAEVTGIETKIRNIHFAGSTQENMATARDLENRVSECSCRVMDMQRKAKQSVESQKNEQKMKVASIEADIRATEDVIATYNRRVQSITENIDADKVKIEELLAQWNAENEKVYVEPEISTVCPTCGQTLPDSSIEATKKNHRQQWHDTKMRVMEDIRTKGGNIRKEMKDLEDSLAAAKSDVAKEQEKCESLLNQLNASRLLEKNIVGYETILENDSKYELAVKERDEAVKQLDEFRASLRNADADNNSAMEMLKEELTQAKNKLSDLERRLNERSINVKIDDQRKQLEQRERVLAQVVADCENVDAQIAGFKKERIAKVEEGVSSLFRIIHWKMYEPNITNDGEKEICQAIIDGVPYEQQNTATKFNAAVDMVNGFMVANDVSIPLFIDNKESVSNLIDTQAQVITLEVNSDQAGVMFNYKK